MKASMSKLLALLRRRSVRHGTFTRDSPHGTGGPRKRCRTLGRLRFPLGAARPSPSIQPLPRALGGGPCALGEYALLDNGKVGFRRRP